MTPLRGMLVRMSEAEGPSVAEATLFVSLDYLSYPQYVARLARASLVEAMRVLEQAGSGSGRPELWSTHPGPDRRVERIEAAIQETYPHGVPEGLKS